MFLGASAIADSVGGPSAQCLGSFATALQALLIDRALPIEPDAEPGEDELLDA